MLKLDASQIRPMYRELLGIDLPTAVKVATARNADIQQARQQVDVSRGRLESTVGAAFPALVPTALFEHVEGTARNTNGSLVGVGFSTFQPSVAVQWVLNPGRVVYDIVAARKRLLVSERQEEAVTMETLRQTAAQYFDLVLAQTQVQTAHQAVGEAEELLRISQLRRRTGTGLPADELRAQARLAERQHDLALAIKTFYDASVELTVTLRLDSTVTLVPKVEQFRLMHLVRDDLSIEEMLTVAVANRPDLASVRTLVEAVTADRGSTWWGAFGPQFQVAYQYGGITGHANNVVQGKGIPGNLIINPASTNGSFSTNPLANGLIKEAISRGSQRAAGSRDQTYGFSDQQRFNTSAGWRLSVSAFGDLKAATATQRQAMIEADRQLDRVRADVVRAAQAGRTYEELIEMSRRQVTSAEEALRLTEANLRAGTMTTLDVLQAEDAVAQARLRYSESVVRHNQAQVNLLAALGLLDESQLELVRRAQSM
jgi:outer membrane protein TolC